MARNKYGNRRLAGFDSAKESRVYAQLCAAQRAHEPCQRVTCIDRQVPYLLVPRQVDEAGQMIERPVTYRADFVVNYADDRVEVIDVKSPPTRKLPAYVLKRKLMLYLHGIRIREV